MRTYFHVCTTSYRCIFKGVYYMLQVNVTPCYYISYRYAVPGLDDLDD